MARKHVESETLLPLTQAGRGPNPGEVVDAIKLRVPGVGTIGNNGDFGGCT